jgi:hypothetical protein
MLLFYKVVDSTSIPIPLNHQTPTSSLPGARKMVSSALKLILRNPKSSCNGRRAANPLQYSCHSPPPPYYIKPRQRRTSPPTRHRPPRPTQAPLFIVLHSYITVRTVSIRKTNQAPHSTIPDPAPTAVLDKKIGRHCRANADFISWEPFLHSPC